MTSLLRDLCLLCVPSATSASTLLARGLDAEDAEETQRTQSGGGA